MTQETALNILKAGASVFLTGEPGAGKTHTINQYVNFLRDCGIEPAITASTGIAATHIGGMTIHSWSGIGIRKTLDARELGVIAANEKLARRMRKTSTLIIDEISMLDGVFLDTLDSVLQTVKENNAPFGGIQIIFVGDFFQLPPVTKHGQSLAVFAFDSQAWNVAKLVTCYLSEQHRQSDQDFLEILAAVRAGLVTKNHENILQTRQRALAQVDQSTLTKLFPHNADVDYINDLELQKLSTAPHTFSMTHTGRAALVEQLQRGCLSPETLHLKVGAIVLFTKNNQPAHYFNGTIGTVIDFDSESKYPIVKIQNGREILAEPVEWALEDSGKVLASITQVPLRLAWAITVHKSQGMSLDAAYMDLTESFVPGQGYVALSRVRALSGLHIAGWNTMALSVHPEVLIKDRDFRSASFAAEEYCTSLSPTEFAQKQINFIAKSGGKIPAAGSVPVRRKKQGASKVSTYEQTLEYFREGKNIGEIATIRALTEGTILSHFEFLLEKEIVTRPEISRLIEGSFYENILEIQKVFRQLETDKLTTVFQKCQGKYSYYELRLARLVLEP